jgi:hypothetical protein
VTVKNNIQATMAYVFGFGAYIFLSACGQPAAQSAEVARLQQELELEKAKNGAGAAVDAAAAAAEPVAPQPLEQQVGYSTAIRCAALATWFEPRDEEDAASLRVVLVNAKRVGRYHADRMSVIPNIEAAVQQELIQLRFGTPESEFKGVQDDYAINCAALKTGS